MFGFCCSWLINNKDICVLSGRIGAGEGGRLAQAPMGRSPAQDGTLHHYNRCVDLYTRNCTYLLYFIYIL